MKELLEMFRESPWMSLLALLLVVALVTLSDPFLYQLLIK